MKHKIEENHDYPYSFNSLLKLTCNNNKPSVVQAMSGLTYPAFNNSSIFMQDNITVVHNVRGKCCTVFLPNVTRCYRERVCQYAGISRLAQSMRVKINILLINIDFF